MKTQAKVMLTRLSVLSIGMFVCMAVAPNASAADPGKDAESALINRTFDATAILLRPEISGGTRMLCTVTAIEKTAKAYRFLSAAHCVAEDDELRKRVHLHDTKYFISFDEEGSKKLLQATVVVAGYQHRGDDFAVLEVALKDMEGLTPPVIPLASKEAQMGEYLINIAAPGGFGRQLFRGHVSMKRINRPIKIDDINWENAMFIQMEIGSGSSGSAIVSISQGGIVGCVVGFVSGNSVAIPIERFKKFWASFQKGEYKWFRPEDAADGGG